MKNTSFKIFLILLIAILVISCTTTKNIDSLDKLKTYTPISKELFDTIVQMDSIVFDAANKGDLGKLKTLFTAIVRKEFLEKY